jgi:hypothetical protein
MAKYKNTKQLAKSVKKEISDSKLHKYLIFIPLIALFIKFITIGNIPGGGWYGADGENYATGVDALIADGFFSKDGILSYWPAGYPMLLWPLASISIPKFFYMISIIQSIFFAYSTYFFTNKLRTSSLKYLAFWVSIFISFNPTLSLSSLAVGYEAPIASCFMMIAGLIWSTANTPIDRNFWLKASYVGGWLSLASFLQPRYLLVGVVLALLWALRIFGRKNRFRLAALVTVVMLIAPTTLIFRNAVAIDKATISTNLGVTMRIGAGPDTSGGFQRTGAEVPCKPKRPGAEVSDNEIVVCVIKWYLTNPIDTARLSFNKALFFWSPWSGPEVEGTMARNPWLKISPAQKIASGSESGRSFIYGPFGVLISWVWIISQIIFLFAGYRFLRQSGAAEKFFANIFLVPVVLSWLISIGTIGDHRFRVPTMSLSIFLQVVAFLAIRKKLNERIG